MMRVRFASAVTAVIAMSWMSVAQPQAPIEWGEARWANLAGWPGLPQIGALDVTPVGDTVLFKALSVASPVSDTVLVCSSFDNGETFTPWINLTSGQESVAAYMAGSAGRFYCFINRIEPQPPACWILRSEDGGLTWNPPQEYRETIGFMGGFASGNDVLVKYIGQFDNNWSTITIHSTTGGVTWSAPVLVDTADFMLLNFNRNIAFTQSQCLIIEEPAPAREDYRYYVARGDRPGSNWTGFEVLPCSYYQQRTSGNRVVVIGDTASEASGILGEYGGMDFNYFQPLYSRSANVGMGWEDCTALTDEPYVIHFYLSRPLNIGKGKLWLVGWQHRRDEGQGWEFLKIRFSANHGRNWYPIETIADSVAEVFGLNGQIRGEQIDIYWDQLCFGCPGTHDFRMISGTITPDTLLPELTMISATPETVSVGQQLQFNLFATDNDTLSRVNLQISELDGDTLRFGMAHNGSHEYQFSWTVPDSGFYQYWFEAEDWWENVAELPDSASFHFVTEGWTRINDIVVPPSSFSLSVFPNPSNGWPNVRLSSDWFRSEPVVLTVYNTLGQRVIEMAVQAPVSGIGHSAPEASGVYLLRVSNSHRSSLTKFVVLK